MSARLRIESPRVAIANPRRGKMAARYALLGSGAGLVAGIVAAAAAVVTEGTAFSLIVSAAVALFFSLIATGVTHGESTAGARRRAREGHVEIDGGSVRVRSGARELAFDAQSIESAWTETLSGVEVVLTLRGGEVVSVATANADQANALVQALGVGPAQRAAVIRFGSQDTRAERGLAAVLAGCLGALTIPWLLVGGALIVQVLRSGSGGVGVSVLFVLIGLLLGSYGGWLVLRPFATSTLVIGADGVLIKELLRRRFVSFKEIRGVHARANMRRVSLDTGDEMITVRASNDNEARAAAERIREAMATAADGDGARGSAMLDRGGRSLDEWRAALRGLTQAERGYREASLSLDDLLSVVGSAAARPERRVAAAVALANAEDADVKKRLRVAADVVAEPRLRVALEHALAGELDEASLEAAERAQRKKA